MDIKGEYIIPGDVSSVWSHLNNEDILKKTIPGCKKFEKKSEEEYFSVIGLKIGPVSAKFNCKIFLTTIVPKKEYKISGEGQGGITGFAKGDCLIQLEEILGEQISTKLSYTAKANIGGKIARLGNRLLDSTVKKLSNQFFKNFTDKLKELDKLKIIAK